MSGRGRIAAGALLVAGAVGWLVASLVETDRERIEEIVEVCRGAFLAGDADAVCALLAEDAEGEGILGRGPLPPLVRRWVARASGRLRGASLSRKEIVVDGDEARGSWVGIVRLRPGEAVPAVRLMLGLDFHRGPEGWRIRRAEVVSP